MNILAAIRREKRKLEKQVRYPPRSGWLDEWGRLKGGSPVGSGVALKRVLV
jgi:hypothetical protein